MPEVTSNLDRRAFLQSLGGGLLVLFSYDGVVTAQESGGRRRRHEELPQTVDAWLHIAPDGVITTFTGKVEVGQNVRTSLTQAVADELRCKPESIRMVMGDTARTPWDMGTFGSRTMPTMAPEVRKMASTAREALIDEAAKRWNMDRGRLQASGGCICDKNSAKKATLGELAGAINWVTVTGRSDYVTPPDRWSVAGTSLPKVNAKEIVSGKHKYSSDHKLPGMLYGRVLRPPSFGAKLVSADTNAAAKIPGVHVARDGDFIAVAATDEQRAQQALSRIDAKWEEKKQISASELFPYIRSSGNAERPKPFPGAAHSLAGTYTIAYIAHTPLEPRAAVAEFRDGQLTVWTGTQRPFGVRSELAEALQMDEKNVRVLMPDTGSAYGGKHSGECAVEAARIAKAVGKPVKLIWTREEEFTWAYFRPAGIIDVRSAMDKDGTLQRWDFIITCPARRRFEHHTKLPTSRSSFTRWIRLCEMAPTGVSFDRK